MNRVTERNCCFSLNIFKDRTTMKTKKLNTIVAFNTNNTSIKTNNNSIRTNNTSIKTNNTNRMVKHRIDNIDLTN